MNKKTYLSNLVVLPVIIPNAAPRINANIIPKIKAGLKSVAELFSATISSVIEIGKADSDSVSPLS